MTNRSIVGLLLVLSGCGVSSLAPCEVPGSYDEVLAWYDEPRVGVLEGSEELVENTKEALGMWGWGVYVEGCEGADICISETPFGDKPVLGTANFDKGSTSCDVSIHVTDTSVIAHELGHCYGLEHSDEEDSLMYETYKGGRSVTGNDHQRLSAVNSECLGI